MFAVLAALAIFSAAYAGETPAYPGGDKAMYEFVAKNIVYPIAAVENGVEGVVTISATVTPEGKLTSLKVVRLVDPDLEKEALRIVSLMPAWIPADKDGIPVESTVKIPISFKMKKVCN